MPAVEVNNIVKSYGTRNVVENVTFAVEQGQILGLIGPNGAGKTTTIRMMMDIIKPDSGEVRILGKPFSEESKNLVGYLPEERGLYKKMTILDTLLYFASLKGMEPADAAAGAEKWLARVNLSAHKNKKMEELSHGMAQLVQIVSTVLHEPKLLIFDEPFNGLDPVNMQLVKEIIAERRERQGPHSQHPPHERGRGAMRFGVHDKQRQGRSSGAACRHKEAFPRQHAGDRQRQPHR
jgi:ABC-2 type transport system ATP-binding protein